MLKILSKTFFVLESAIYLCHKFQTQSKQLMTTTDYHNSFLQRQTSSLFRKRHGILPILSLLSLLLVLPILIGCASCSSGGEYDFRSRKEALDKYHAYLHKVRSVAYSNTKEFGETLREWQEVSDTVYKYLAKDSVFIRHHNEANNFFLVHDSVRAEMLRLTETWKYGYGDVLAIKDMTCTYKEDQELLDAVRDAEPFFNSLDSASISVCDKASILKRYRYFLQEAKNTDFNSRNELLRFIRQEDFLFRSFLAHLYEMDNEPLSDITKNTEQICRNIFLAAKNGKISSKDVVVYMSMRTVRRLLQNSAECVENINRLEMKNKAQGNAYIWMIIQPFISIDQFSLATMTAQERQKFNYVVTQLPKSKKFAETFDINLKALNYLLPQQLLKIYVSSL